MTTDDLSEFTPAERDCYHRLRVRAAEFTIRLFDQATKRGKLPTGKELARRAFDAGWAEDFAPRKASR